MNRTGKRASEEPRDVETVAVELAEDELQLIHELLEDHEQEIPFRGPYSAVRSTLGTAQREVAAGLEVFRRGDDYDCDEQGHRWESDIHYVTAAWSNRTAFDSFRQGCCVCPAVRVLTDAGWEVLDRYDLAGASLDGEAIVPPEDDAETHEQGERGE